MRRILAGAVWVVAAYAQPWSTFIDPSRAIDWSGVNLTIPDYTVACVTQPTLVANDPNSAIINNTQIQNALASCDATHNVVNIPAGTYYVFGWTYGSQGNQVVRGAGPMSTTIYPVMYGGIAMQPANPQDVSGGAITPPSGTQQCLWTGGFSKVTAGTSVLTLSSCGGAPTSGQMMILAQSNDGSDPGGIYVCDSFLPGCAVESGSPANPVGPRLGGVTYAQQQVVWIQSVTNNGDGTYAVTISPGNYFNNVRIGQNPYARWPNTVQSEGIENLTVNHGYLFPAPTVGTPTSGGSCTPGTHSIVVEFIYDAPNFTNYSSVPTASSAQFTCVATTGQTVPVTIPLGPTGTSSRQIFATIAGDVGNYILATIINDNTTTSYSYTLADSSLNNGVSVTDNTPIAITNCYRCWVKNIRSLYAGRDHISVFQSLGTIVRDSYFYEALTHGSSSYGVELTIATGTVIENNIFQTLVNSIMFGQGFGSVVGYNFAINEGFGPGNVNAQTVDTGHNAGNGMNLWEGNNFFGIWVDIGWGSSSTATLFRNILRGWQRGVTQYTSVLQEPSWDRAFNDVGNVLGQPGYHSNYESYATSSTGGVNGGSPTSDLSVFNLGWSSAAANAACITPPVCDPLVRASLVRWGNYDTVNAAIRWDNTEASPAAMTFVNANFTSSYFSTLTHTLPNSLYYSSKPSWWPSSKPWPPVGPDVTTGNVGTCIGGTYGATDVTKPGASATSSSQCTGGTLASPSSTTQAWASHAVSLPAQDCYLNTMSGPPDGSGGVLSFDANVCYYGTTSWSGFLDTSRAIDWTAPANQAGFPIPNYTVACATQPVLASGSASAAANTTAIQNALNSCDATHNVVNIPAGTWYAAGWTYGSQGQQVVRGASPNTTTMILTGEVSCGGINHGVCMISGAFSFTGSTWVLPPSGNQQCAWTGGYGKGTTSITLNTCPGGAPPLNQILILDQQNDTADTGGIYICDSTVTGCTAEASDTGGRVISGVTHTMQQVVIPIAVTGSGTGPFTVTLSTPLYFNNVRSAQVPGAWWPGTVANDGLENITLDGTAIPDGTMAMFDCYQCWVRNSRFLNAGRNHLLVMQSSQDVIRDNYFYGAQGSGATSYGIEFEISSGVLVENNIMQQITASIMFGVGTGSVIDYNYVINSSYAGTSFQGAYYGHSGGNQMVLWEGNNFLGIWTDAVHGSTATGTFFRNMLRGWQTAKPLVNFPLAFRSWHRAQNVVGNILGQPGTQNTYESYATSSTAGVNASTASTSIYEIGWSDYGGLGTCTSTGQPVACDPLARSTLMRWGNWDVVNNATQWNATEASPGAVPYVNANFTSSYFSTLAQTLPASLYYTAKPSWWPTSKAWPVIGPDITTGNVGLCNGGTYAGAQATSSTQCSGGTLTTPATAYQSHVVSIPAQDCYLNVMHGPTDGSGAVLPFDANVCYYGATAPTTPTSYSGTLSGSFH